MAKKIFAPFPRNIGRSPRASLTPRTQEYNRAMAGSRHPLILGLPGCAKRCTATTEERGDVPVVPDAVGSEPEGYQGRLLVHTKWMTRGHGGDNGWVSFNPYADITAQPTISDVNRSPKQTSSAPPGWQTFYRCNNPLRLHTQRVAESTYRIDPHMRCRSQRWRLSAGFEPV